MTCHVHEVEITHFVEMRGANRVAVVYWRHELAVHVRVAKKDEVVFPLVVDAVDAGVLPPLDDVVVARV